MTQPFGVQLHLLVNQKNQHHEKIIITSLSDVTYGLPIRR